MTERKAQIRPHSQTCVIYQVTTHGQEGKLYTDLHLIPPAKGRSIVIFTNGAGRADFDPTHRFLADKFQSQSFGCCHMRINELSRSAALPTPLREIDAYFASFSIETIGRVILASAEFLRQQESFRNSKLCLFGSGEGAAAALFAAALNPGAFTAMVMSGARLSTALVYLSKNTVPTLLALGEKDNVAATTTRAAFNALPGRKELLEIEGAGHLLREPGALEKVAEKSFHWFTQFEDRPQEYLT